MKNVTSSDFCICYDTAVLSWHVQIFVASCQLAVELQLNEYK